MDSGLCPCSVTSPYLSKSHVGRAAVSAERVSVVIDDGEGGYEECGGFTRGTR